MKKFERYLLLMLLAASALLVLASLASFAPMFPDRWPATADLFGTAGLLVALSGFVQLDVTNFFDTLLREYGDEEKYPYGPPSHITRQIIDNPDQPIRTSVRNALYFFPRTGFALVCLGTTLQIISLWT